MSIGACTRQPTGPTIWIYTSLYNTVIQDLDPKIHKQFPELSFKWYQSGSENVAAKVTSELLSGKTQADLILTSDPFWYEELKSQNRLLAYDSPAARELAAAMKDPAHFYATVRMPAMVIAYNSDAVAAADAPRSFADLTLPRFKNKVALGNPLESGTVFTTVAMLTRKLGWDYIASLRANGLMSAGGNTAVLSRIETKERPVGIVLLENVLQAQKKNPKIMYVIPKEGAVLIPSPVAIMASTPDPDLAKKVYDFLFSEGAQESIVGVGAMHSPLPRAKAPVGAPSYEQMMSTSFVWNAVVIQEILKARSETKQKYSKLVLE